MAQGTQGIPAWISQFRWEQKSNRLQDFEQAHDLFLQEAQTGNALAMHDLGRMHADCLGRTDDRDAAHEWYARALSGFLQIESAVDSDDSKATYLRYRIGKMYMAGLGTEQDYEQAASWLSAAAAVGHKYAQYSLGGLYYRGQGVEQNFESALELYSKSAAHNNAYASYELGKMLRDGIGAQQNQSEAERHFQVAYNGFVAMELKVADDKLQYRIGQMLRDGVGVEQNAEQAEFYFEHSSKLGNTLHNATCSPSLCQAYFNGQEAAVYCSTNTNRYM